MIRWVFNISCQFTSEILKMYRYSEKLEYHGFLRWFFNFQCFFENFELEFSYSKRKLLNKKKWSKFWGLSFKANQFICKERKIRFWQKQKKNAHWFFKNYFINFLRTIQLCFRSFSNANNCFASPVYDSFLFTIFMEEDAQTP